jgi:peptidyl-prolyl cis-trans isomerase D
VIAATPVTNKGSTSLGELTEGVKGDIPDVIFSLKENTASKPIFASVRWHIYYVGKIDTGHVLDFREAHDAIAHDIAAREAQDTIVKIMNGFEDTLASGEPLEKAAGSIGEKLRGIGPVTRNGTGPDGQKVDLPPYDNFLNVAFATAEKDHSQGVQAKDGSYFIVRVDSVVPEHVRPLAEVKQEVNAAALKEKANMKLEKTAGDISEQLRAGKKPAAVLAASGISEQPVPSGNLLRTDQGVSDGLLKDKILPPALLSELFHIKPGQSTHAYPLPGEGYIIATLNTVVPAPEKPDPTVVSKIRADLLETYQDDILHQYLGYLRTKYPISVNSSAFSQKEERDGD